MQSNKVRKMAECSMLIALATVLSVFKLVEMPYGGSVTLASMLPLVIIAYRHGTAFGLLSGLLYGLIQQILGLHHLSYFTTWYSILAVMLLDYLVAFAVIGFSGLFRRAGTQKRAMTLGTLFACLLRYVCHMVGGATVWVGLSIPTEAALLYSIGYNATYMIPETVVLTVTVGYVASMLDFRRNIPTRIASEKPCAQRDLCYALSGLFAVATVIVACVMIFPCMQDPESGAFALEGLAEVNWLTLGVIGGIGLLTAAVLRIAGARMKAEEEN